MIDWGPSGRLEFHRRGVVFRPSPQLGLDDILKVLDMTVGLPVPVQVPDGDGSGSREPVTASPSGQEEADKTAPKWLTDTAGGTYLFRFDYAEVTEVCVCRTTQSRMWRYMGAEDYV